MKKEYLSGISVIKFICAVLIVFIHTEPFSSINSTINSLLVNYLCRIAVPFFFLCSSFLLYRKKDALLKGTHIVAKYIAKIAKLYIIWSLIYLPFCLIDIFKAPAGKDRALALINYGKNMIFSAGYGFLWYLPATIVAVSIVTVLLRNGMSVNKVIVIGGILYCVGLFGQSYYGLAELLFSGTGLFKAFNDMLDFIVSTRNGVFEGVVFVALGAKLAQTQRPTPRKAFLGFMICMLLLLVETYVLSELQWKHGYDMYLMLVPCAYFLFELALCFKFTDDNKAKILGELSALVYFTHMLFVELAEVIHSYVPLHSMARFALVYTLSILLSVAVLLLSKQKRFCFLKEIY